MLEVVAFRELAVCLKALQINGLLAMGVEPLLPGDCNLLRLFTCMNSQCGRRLPF